MPFRLIVLSAVGVAFVGMPALAGDILVKDGYARSSGALSRSGAAFMTLVNQGDKSDRLVDVRSEAAARAELHTHKENTDGVMQMRKVEDGFVIPAGGAHMLQRGGDHVMLMGLTVPLEQGDTVTVTLVFEKAGDVTIELPVDLERKNNRHRHSYQAKGAP